jgi:ribosomal protein S3AE
MLIFEIIKMVKKEKKKKSWIKILAPSMFRNKVIGETIKRDKLIGKTIKVSLSNLIGDMKKQNINLGFVITNVKDDKAETEIYKYFLSIGYLKRLVRKVRNKIDDSFIAETKDKIKIKIKPVMITRGRTSKARLTAIRKLSRELLTKFVKENSFEDFIREVGSFRIQIRLKQTLRKIYPLGLYEIRHIEKVK